MIEIVEYAGMTMGLVGLVLMYKYSISPNVKKGSATYIYTHEESKKMKAEEAKREKHFKFMNTLGFLLTLSSMLITFWVRALK